ncbi:MAG: hypothetical protein DRN28_06420 [Thermoplasmata archaeon]|nr:MAG: hypothetical protein DRN28_06420 [Thermoplasmata archaeon]
MGMNELSIKDVKIKEWDGEVYLAVGDGRPFPVSDVMVSQRRRFSYLYLVMGFVLLVFTVAHFIFFIVGAGVLALYFLFNPTRYVLEVSGSEGKMTLEGGRKEIKDLHYEITLALSRSGKIRREATEERPLSRDELLGRVRAEELMDSEDVERLKEGFERRIVKKGRRKIVSLQCPHCGGRELYYEGAFFFGGVYHCKDCDYVGPFVIEKEIVVEDS